MLKPENGNWNYQNSDTVGVDFAVSDGGSRCGASVKEALQSVDLPDEDITKELCKQQLQLMTERL